MGEQLQETKMPQAFIPPSATKPDTYSDLAPQPRDSIRVRLSARLHRGALDEKIARGVETAGDRALALRAEQLASRAQRDRLATALERTLDPAETLAARGLTARVPLQVRAIRDCADDIEALARRLRDGKPIDAQGAALTRRLLTNGASPLYYRHSPHTLRYAVRSSRLALEPVSSPVEASLAA
jgi:hypothetical protein